MDKWTFELITDLNQRIENLENIIAKEHPEYLENATESQNKLAEQSKERKVEEHKAAERK